MAAKMASRESGCGLALSGVVALLGATTLALTMSDNWPPGFRNGANQTLPPSVATVYVGVDLPFKGPHRAEAAITWDALNFYLQQLNHRVGRYTVRLKKYNNSTDNSEGWDRARCAANAGEHVANADEVAVIGTLDTGCTQVLLPVLNQAAQGPMLMVSWADTWTGLTKSLQPDEPEKYFPTGLRSFARVIANDDIVGRASAEFARNELKTRKALVLDDGTVFGRGIAEAFYDSIGLFPEDAQRGSWSDSASVAAIISQAVALKADTIFLGGIIRAAGVQLMKDAKSALGSSTNLVVVGEMSSADRARIPKSVFWNSLRAGLSGEDWAGTEGAPAKFRADFQTSIGNDIYDELNAVQALQVALAAIEESDGSRVGVRNAVFENDGIVVSHDKAMLGAEVRIDRATGDINIRHVSAYAMNGGLGMTRWSIEMHSGVERK
jgi:branched-chain amino acid transport system substrate-binding protein